MKKEASITLCSLRPLSISRKDYLYPHKPYFISELFKNHPSVSCHFYQSKAVKYVLKSLNVFVKVIPLRRRVIDAIKVLTVNEAVIDSFVF